MKAYRIDNFFEFVGKKPYSTDEELNYVINTNAVEVELSDEEVDDLCPVEDLDTGTRRVSEMPLPKAYVKCSQISRDMTITFEQIYFFEQSDQKAINRHAKAAGIAIANTYFYLVEDYMERDAYEAVRLRKRFGRD